jgi:hypothetical protein
MLSLSFAGGLAAIILYQVARAIHRLYFHPLASFPGPKVVAISRWLVTLESFRICTRLKTMNNRRYEFYYEVIKGGRFGDQIEKFHGEYGE